MGVVKSGVRPLQAAVATPVPTAGSCSRRLTRDRTSPSTALGAGDRPENATARRSTGVSEMRSRQARAEHDPAELLPRRHRHRRLGARRDDRSPGMRSRRAAGAVRRRRTAEFGRERNCGGEPADRHGAAAFAAGTASGVRRFPASNGALRMVVARSSLPVLDRSGSQAVGFRFGDIAEVRTVAQVVVRARAPRWHHAASALLEFDQGVGR